MSQTTLAIDFGSKNIGLALVRNENDTGDLLPTCGSHEKEYPDQI
jgi:RNase H-fold protein (predicted Holliday junction resolvase)